MKAAVGIAVLVLTQAQTATSAGQSAKAPAPAYTYQTEGRRDPFVSLIDRGTDPKLAASRPTGLPGIAIEEVAVKGIMKDRSGFMAMLLGPDNRTHWVRSGEKLLDGSVKAVRADAVVFVQDVSDPLSVVKQREVVKKIRAAEGGRE